MIEGWWAGAEEGRFSVHQLGFHVAGIPTYMPVGELATGRVLSGTLDRPVGYPVALRASAPDYWLRRAASELGYAGYWVADGNAVSLAGALARAVLESAHAVLAGQGRWALNEKRMVRAAGLESLIPVLGRIGTSQEEKQRTRLAVEAALGGGAHQALNLSQPTLQRGSGRSMLQRRPPGQYPPSSPAASSSADSPVIDQIPVIALRRVTRSSIVLGVMMVMVRRVRGGVAVVGVSPALP